MDPRLVLTQSLCFPDIANNADPVSRRMRTEELVASTEFSGLPRYGPNVIQKPPGWHLQRLGDLVEDDDGRVAHPALDAADVGPVARQAAAKASAITAPPNLRMLIFSSI